MVISNRPSGSSRSIGRSSPVSTSRTSMERAAGLSARSTTAPRSACGPSSENGSRCRAPASAAKAAEFDREACFTGGTRGTAAGFVPALPRSGWLLRDGRALDVVQLREFLVQVCVAVRGDLPLVRLLPVLRGDLL